jgi:uncharacterized protein YukE
MTVQLDADVPARVAALAARAASMQEERLATGRQVQALLTAWRGDAADAFAEAWREWERCTGEVVAALAADVERLHAGHRLLGHVDAAAGERVALLQDRLGR